MWQSKSHSSQKSHSKQSGLGRRDGALKRSKNARRITDQGETLSSLTPLNLSSDNSNSGDLRTVKIRVDSQGKPVKRDTPERKSSFVISHPSDDTHFSERQKSFRNSKYAITGYSKRGNSRSNKRYLNDSKILAVSPRVIKEKEIVQKRVRLNSYSHSDSQVVVYSDQVVFRESSKYSFNEDLVLLDRDHKIFKSPYHSIIKERKLAKEDGNGEHQITLETKRMNSGKASKFFCIVRIDNERPETQYHGKILHRLINEMIGELKEYSNISGVLSDEKKRYEINEHMIVIKSLKYEVKTLEKRLMKKQKADSPCDSHHSLQDPSPSIMRGEKISSQSDEIFCNTIEERFNVMDSETQQKHSDFSGVNDSISMGNIFKSPNTLESKRSGRKSRSDSSKNLVQEENSEVNGELEVSFDDQHNGPFSSDMDGEDRFSDKDKHIEAELSEIKSNPKDRNHDDTKDISGEEITHFNEYREFGSIENGDTLSTEGAQISSVMKISTDRPAPDASKQTFMSDMASHKTISKDGSEGIIKNNLNNLSDDEEIKKDCDLSLSTGSFDHIEIENGVSKLLDSASVNKVDVNDGGHVMYNHEHEKGILSEKSVSKREEHKSMEGDKSKGEDHSKEEYKLDEENKSQEEVENIKLDQVDDLHNSNEGNTTQDKVDSIESNQDDDTHNSKEEDRSKVEYKYDEENISQEGVENVGLYQIDESFKSKKDDNSREDVTNIGMNEVEESFKSKEDETSREDITNIGMNEVEESFKSKEDETSHEDLTNIGMNEVDESCQSNEYNTSREAVTKLRFDEVDESYRSNEYNTSQEYLDNLELSQIDDSRDSGEVNLSKVEYKYNEENKSQEEVEYVELGQIDDSHNSDEEDRSNLEYKCEEKCKSQEELDNTELYHPMNKDQFTENNSLIEVDEYMGGGKSTEENIITERDKIQEEDGAINVDKFIGEDRYCDSHNEFNDLVPDKGPDKLIEENNVMFDSHDDLLRSGADFGDCLTDISHNRISNETGLDHEYLELASPNRSDMHDSNLSSESELVLDSQSLFSDHERPEVQSDKSLESDGLPSKQNICPTPKFAMDDDMDISLSPKQALPTSDKDRENSYHTPLYNSISASLGTVESNFKTEDSNDDMGHVTDNVNELNEVTCVDGRIDDEYSGIGSSSLQLMEQMESITSMVSEDSQERANDAFLVELSEPAETVDKRGSTSQQGYRPSESKAMNISMSNTQCSLPETVIEPLIVRDQSEIVTESPKPSVRKKGGVLKPLTMAICAVCVVFFVQAII